MAQDNELYQDPDVFQGVADDNLALKYLALSGINKMPIPFRAISGDTRKPSYSCQEDSRTGIYFPAKGIVGIVRAGVDVLWVLKDTLRLFDRSGNYVDLVIPDQLGADFALALPSLDGSLLLREQLVTEEIIGTKDGVNTAFTVTHDIHAVHAVFFNADFALEEISYSPGSNSVTWVGATIPDVGDKVYVTYVRQ